MLNVIKVKDKVEGNLKAHDILKDILDSQTLLAFSGGTSPNYISMIVEPGDILPGAICVVDERYGDEFHENSNELLLKNAGVLEFAQNNNIEFYKVLSGKSFDATGEDYDQMISELLPKFPKRVGVMGIGSNLHTAGIFPNSLAAHSPNFVVGEEVEEKQSLRSSPAERDAGLKFPQRITLTLRTLGEFQAFVILAFGDEKKEALKKMLDKNENDMQKFPAIFYRKSPAKAYLITDQQI